ncbi:AAA family ATPase [Desulfobacterota bacterium M19]
MYQQFFNISQKPFSIAPDPAFLYMSDGHREALAHLRYGLENDGGFVLLTGEVGAGKTTVCRCLLEQVPADTNIAFIINPKLTPLEFLASICDELKIEYHRGAGGKELVDAVNNYLLAVHAGGGRTVLIIDEAQNLDLEVLEQIRMLTNLETNERKLLQIIMLGQPELQEKLADPQLKQLAQRISARHHLGPLNRAETTAYVRHRLAVAGLSPDIFSDRSLKKLFSLSAGIPRLINMVCDRALLAAYTKGIHLVDSRLLDTAATEVLGLRKKGRGGFRPFSPWLVALIVLLVCLAALTLLLRHPRLRQGVSPVRPAVPAAPEMLKGGKVNKDNAHLSFNLRYEAAEPFLSAVEWKDMEVAGRDKRLAMGDLLRLWGLKGFSAAEEWGCQYAEKHGLRCLSATSGMAALRRLNRPVVLRLAGDDQGGKSFVLLAADHGRWLDLRLDGRHWRVLPADLAQHWQGVYILVWRPPAGYEDSIRPGYRGHMVKWLAERLALIDGEEYNKRTGRAVYDSGLVRRVRQLQFRYNLIPDGIVGKETVILLNTLTGAGGPELRHPESVGLKLMGKS